MHIMQKQKMCLNCLDSVQSLIESIPSLVIIVFIRSQFTDSMILALMRMNLNPPLLSKGRFTLVAVEFDSSPLRYDPEPLTYC